MREYLNDGWRFFKQWEDTMSGAAGEEVRIPHANVVTPFNNYDESVYQFECGYARDLVLDDTDGKTFLLTFEGVAHLAEVFVNGASVITHRSGYTAFTVDITDRVFAGINKIAVRADARPDVNQPPFGYVIDYQTYGGIYRDVYLDVKNGTYVIDAFVKAQPDRPVEAEVTLGNFRDSAEVYAAIRDGDETVYSQSLTVNSVKFSVSLAADLELWSLDSPKLYTFCVKVGSDEYSATFGVRKAEFTKDGFYLNGRKIKLVGLNRHQSYPYVGYAMPESMQRQDARILKNKLGVNIVRTSHYPQSQYFVDECDRLGLLVFTEIPGWQHIGDGEWKAQAIRNVEEMVTQYRNHPSIVLWGVRINESVDCDEMYRQTNALAHTLDPTRQTGGVRYLRNSSFLEDVYTFNDFNRDGATDRNLICGKNAPYLVTEYNGHMFSTKTFDDAPHQLAHALRYVKMLDDVYRSDATCGAIGWCMFDYNTQVECGSGDRICYHGVLDMFRNPKLASSVFASVGSKEPFIEVSFAVDKGDYPEAVIPQMYCFTNVDTVKFYRGGSFVREFTHADSPYKHIPNAPILIDDLIGDRLVDEEGFSVKTSDNIKLCINAIKKYGLNTLPFKYKWKIYRIMKTNKLSLADMERLYRKYEGNWGEKENHIVLEGYVNGKLAVTKTVDSSHSYSLEVTPSTTSLCEKTSYDVASVSIVARDQNGNVCPYVNKAVSLRCEGAVELIGEPLIALAGGRFGTYVKTVGKKGKGALYVDGQKIEFTVE